LSRHPHQRYTAGASQLHSVVTKVTGETRVTGLTVRDVRTGREQAVPVTGVFEAIGHDPRSELFAGQMPADADGCLLTESPSTRTAIEGVFACGDVVDRAYRQAVTAAGTGCAATIDT
jgi:thioredoxin reductase (NADPH)